MCRNGMKEVNGWEHRDAEVMFKCNGIMKSYEFQCLVCKSGIARVFLSGMVWCEGVTF